MRHRRGDMYTASQVFYERINSNVATTVFDYTRFGVQDVSKRLVHLERHPATKVRFSKKFSFASPEAEAAFREQRSEFIQDHERLDEYMEFTEGLDLLNIRFPDEVIAVSNPYNRPWYLYRSVFWIASVLVMSWPLRVLIVYKTAFVQYQVHKIFGTTREQNNLFINPSQFSSSSCDWNEEPNGLQRIESTIRQNSSLVPSYAEAVQLNQHRNKLYRNAVDIRSYGSIPLLPVNDRKMLSRIYRRREKSAAEAEEETEEDGIECRQKSTESCIPAATKMTEQSVIPSLVKVSAPSTGEAAGACITSSMGNTSVNRSLTVTRVPETFTRALAIARGTIGLEDISLGESDFFNPIEEASARSGCSLQEAAARPGRCLDDDSHEINEKRRQQNDVNNSRQLFLRTAIMKNEEKDKQEHGMDQTNIEKKPAGYTWLDKHVANSLPVHSSKTSEFHSNIQQPQETQEIIPVVSETERARPAASLPLEQLPEEDVDDDDHETLHLASGLSGETTEQIPPDSYSGNHLNPDEIQMDESPPTYEDALSMRRFVLLSPAGNTIQAPPGVEMFMSVSNGGGHIYDDVSQEIDSLSNTSSVDYDNDTSRPRMGPGPRLCSASNAVIIQIMETSL